MGLWMDKYLIKYCDNNQEWDDFCDAQDEAWFWHTTGWIKYCEHSRFGVDARNLSFVIIKEERIMAIVPLLLEVNQVNSGREFTFSGGPTPFFVIDQFAQRLEASAIQHLIWDEIERLATLHNVGRIWMRANVQNNGYLFGINVDNPLARKVFLDTSIYSCIVSLNREEKVLLSEMRKGHKAAVKKSMKQITTVCYDSDNVTIDKLNKFRDFYFSVAGKVTRPPETFDMLFEFIKNGRGLLFEAILDHTIVGYTLVILYKQYAYYAMACVVQEFKDYDVSHFLEWQAFCRLKQENIIYYELGEQHFGSSLSCIVTDKMKSISAFKRGFGGSLYLQCSGEYFFTKDYFDKTYAERLQEYTQAKWGNDIVYKSL
jgi:hypothetical protein